MYANRLLPSPDPDLLAAVDAFFSTHDEVTTLAGFPQQVNVRRGTEHWAIRRWPTGATITSVEWTADALAAARATGVPALPTHATLPERGAQRALLHAGQVYDAVSWTEGRPLNRYGAFTLETGDSLDLPLPDSMAAPAVLIETIRTLAQLHMATAEIAARPDAPVSTLADLHLATAARFATLRKTVGSHAGGNQEIRRWLRCANRILPAAAERLSEAAHLARARDVVLHTELWPGRLLIGDAQEGLALRQITGWTAAAAGVPILDLARLAARGARWNAETAETVVGAYNEIAPLGPEQRRLVPVIAALDLTDITGTMLDAAYHDERLVNDPVQSLLRSGIHTSLRSLETLANVLAPEEQPNRGRPFNRRPGQPTRPKPRRKTQ